MSTAIDSGSRDITDDIDDDVDDKADQPREVDDNDLNADDTRRRASDKSRRISISLRALTVGGVVVVLVAALAVMTWLYLGAKRGLDDQTRQVADTRHAEQVALDYAVNAAIMDYKDLGRWKQDIVKGTTPELADKLTKAGTAMEQIVMPLQWTSTAKPLAAKERSQNNGVYVVDAFVSVETKTVQSADELQSTATYSVTVDSNNAWQITDVGGIAAAVAK